MSEASILSRRAWYLTIIFGTASWWLVQPSNNDEDDVDDIDCDAKDVMKIHKYGESKGINHFCVCVCECFALLFPQTTNFSYLLYVTILYVTILEVNY